ncbi:MAG: serine hydrolase domain-containing protein [Acidobacteriaceae bacterium]
MHPNRRSSISRRQCARFLAGACVTFVIVFLSVLQLSAQDRFDGVRALIHQRIVDGSAPSVAVAVAQHGKIIWEEGFGWANREEMIPATVNTMYSLASISKPLTATALMTLVQAGKIDLDKPINDYLGNAKLHAWIGNTNDATVRRVGNHSSGLPFHFQFFYNNEPYQRPSYDETILRYGNLVSIPGEHYQYSNLGYGTIGYVLARVSGESYPDFMRQAVFLKLGMTHTSVDIGPGLEKFQAIRYDDKGAPIPFYVTDHPGASEIYSSAHDLVRFGMFQLKDHLPDQAKILTDASIEAMQQPTMKISDHLGYGIGWFVGDRLSGYHAVYHTGGMPGVATILTLVPSEDIAVVVLTNSFNRLNCIPVSDAILKVLLPKWQNTPYKPEALAPPFSPSKALLGTWKGTLHTYQKNLPVTLKFLPSGDVHVQIADELASLMDDVRFKDGWLSGKAWGDVKTDDAERHHAITLLFSLKLRGDHLNGAVSAIELGYNPAALSQWLDVKKQP